MIEILMKCAKFRMKIRENFKTVHKMTDWLHKTCAVCLTQYGKKSTKIQKITPAIETKIKCFVWNQFSVEVANYPKVICNNCHRNLYDLERNKVEYLGNWIEKISKVNISCYI